MPGNPSSMISNANAATPKTTWSKNDSNVELYLLKHYIAVDESLALSAVTAVAAKLAFLTPTSPSTAASTAFA